MIKTRPRSQVTPTFTNMKMDTVFGHNKTREFPVTH